MCLGNELLYHLYLSPDATPAEIAGIVASTATVRADGPTFFDRPRFTPRRQCAHRELMDLHISLIGRKNLRREIYQQLRAAIVDGRLRPGSPLPPTRQLARELAVARGTVADAYDRLAADGYTTSRVGAGTFVSGRVPAPIGTRQPRDNGALAPRGLWNAIPLSTAFAREGMFDFRTGLPDASLFPRDGWRRALSRAFKSPRFAGGVYDSPAGHAGLREAIARHIGVARGVVCTASDITVTNGAQQAFDIVARVLLAPGDRVAVEDPGYAPARLLLRSLGARVAGVPVDTQGLVVDRIPRGTKLIYVTPSHQYPLGVAMTLERRLALLEWAERNDAAILEDDYDSEFRFGGRPIEPVQTLDRSGRVLYVGSFSKSMLPTLRLGFLVVPPSVREAVHRAKYVTDWHTPLAAQAALARFIDDGAFAQHVRKVRGVYATRRDRIIRVLERDFREHLEMIPSCAGLHLSAVARHASVRRIQSVVRRASEQGVEVQELAHFAVGARGQSGIVLGYGAVPTARIDEGLRRLRSAFDAG